MTRTPVPLQFWGCSAILSVAADDHERARKAIARRTSDVAGLLQRNGIDAAAVAQRLGASPAIVERLLSEPVPPPAVMLDAEDAIAPGPGRAQAALAAAAERLGDPEWSPATVRLVRLPAPRPEGAAFVLDAARSRPPDGIVLPKAEDPGAVAKVRDVAAARGETRLLLLIETPRGVDAVVALVEAAGDRLAGVVFGAVDYAAAAGVHTSDEGHPLIAWARLRTMNAAAAAGVPIVDGMTLAYPVGPPGATPMEARQVVLDGLGIAHDRAAAAAALSMSGKLVGHPGQLLAVLLAFEAAFGDAAVERWERDVLAYESVTRNGAGVGLVGSSMVDAATDRHNRGLLRRAAALGRWSASRAAELNVISRAEADRLDQPGSPP